MLWSSDLFNWISWIIFFSFSADNVTTKYSASAIALIISIHFRNCVSLLQIFRLSSILIFNFLLSSDSWGFFNVLSNVCKREFCYIFVVISKCLHVLEGYFKPPNGINWKTVNFFSFSLYVNKSTLHSFSYHRKAQDFHMTWWAALCGCPYYEELYLFYIIDSLWEISEFTKRVLLLSGFFSPTPCPMPQFHLLLISLLCCLPHSVHWVFPDLKWVSVLARCFWTML